MRASVLVVAVAIGITVTTLGGCDEDYEECYPGDYQSCDCAGGAFGYAACSPAGDFRSATCVCDGTTPGVDAGDGRSPERSANDGGACVADDGGVDGGRRGYAEACSAAGDCASCLCESFAGLPPICSAPCTTVEECPSPSEQCTNRGVCRPPR